MTRILSTEDLDFEAQFSQLLGSKRESAADVDATVAEIIADVRARGDDALIEYCEKFDRVTLWSETLAFSDAEIDEIVEQVGQADREALVLAAERIRAYHRRQMPEDGRWTDEAGATLGWRWTPVASAGLYVPGGLASYPSSLLMNAIPARVAGVERLVVCVPTPDGQVNPLVLLAARLAEVDAVYRVGGAQAVAALAYGTRTIAPVDKITGPGNAYVAAAKRQVFGQVGIDMIAGPSEVLIVADRHNEPEWIALDLLSQAEHDESAQSILITTDRTFAEVVGTCVERMLGGLERRAIAEASWRDNGAIIIARDLGEAAALADRIAPEHLELCVENPDAMLPNLRHAGAIFVGAFTPEAIGDYVAGPNHVLPTARSARFSSGLSVLDFLKRTTITALSPEALLNLGPAAERLAAAEGLQAHGASVSARLARLNRKGEQ